MRERLDSVSAESVCRLTYDGVLYDEAYTDFLHSCHIGLSTQDPAGAFNATSFPSKVLSYMASGLRVVSARIPVVESSLVGDCLYYYGEQSPEAIAAAIQRVDLSDGYDGKAVLRRLDEEFLGDLKKMIFESAW
jgi:glycosyltransferase involved in cell wall biosynthesis